MPPHPPLILQPWYVLRCLFYRHPRAHTIAQSSGVGVNPDCLEAYQELKLGKKNKYIIFTLNKDNTEIVVEKKGGLSSSYDDFIADLPEQDCRWAVYDFDFEKEDGGKRSKITFFSW